MVYRIFQYNGDWWPLELGEDYFLGVARGEVEKDLSMMRLKMPLSESSRSPVYWGFRGCLWEMLALCHFTISHACLTCLRPLALALSFTFLLFPTCFLMIALWWTGHGVYWTWYIYPNNMPVILKVDLLNKKALRIFKSSYDKDRLKKPVEK